MTPRRHISQNSETSSKSSFTGFIILKPLVVHSGFAPRRPLAFEVQIICGKHTPQKAIALYKLDYFINQAKYRRI